MAERIKLLAHHIRQIRFASYGIKDAWGAELNANLGYLPVLRQTYIKGTNELAYPQLENEKAQKIYIQAKARAILAVNLNNYEKISELDPETGEENFDIICKACGNKEHNVCTLRKKVLDSLSDGGPNANGLEFRSRW